MARSKWKPDDLFRHYFRLFREAHLYIAPEDKQVRVGKSIRFTLEAADEESARAEVTDMCTRFLSNPVIEDVDIHIGAVAPA